MGILDSFGRALDALGEWLRPPVKRPPVSGLDVCYCGHNRWEHHRYSKLKMTGSCVYENCPCTEFWAEGD